jgi:methyl-accepting chemotaxis protein
MPFMASMPGGGGAPAGGGAVTMRVAPDQVLALRARLAAVSLDVGDFIRAQGDALRAKPLALDEVSHDAADDFANNAKTAIDVAQQFVDELDRTIDALNRAAETYNLIEDVNTSAMQQQNRGI